MKRAQSTLEFLLTYGWMLIVVLTIIGLLAYFGVMNPKNLIGDQCIVSSTFLCAGNAVTNKTASLIVFENRVNYAFYLDSAKTALPPECTSIEYCDADGANCANPKFIAINAKFMAKLSCDNAPYARVRRELSINYTNSLSGLGEDTKVFISSKVVQ